MHRRTPTRRLLALLTLLGPALFCPRPVAAEPPTDAALAATIDQLAAKALQGPGAAALSIAVARGDTFVLNKGYGIADLEHGVPATQTTLFRIGSVTKQYTAAAIMKLVEQGKLALDDDFTKYIDYPTQGKTVTIRHLLTHTSGIKSYTDLPDFAAGSAADMAPEKVLDPVRNLPFEFEPGAKWAYNNSGYHLLGMIIEKVSGVPYAQHLQNEFFTPLGLTQTRYDVGADIIPGRARGYRLLDGKPANAAHLGMTIPYAAGGLMATAHDLVAWQLALVAGRAVSLDSYKQMTTPATLSDGSATDYGFGLKIRNLDGHPCILHGGGIYGFNSMLLYLPDEKLSIAVISSSESVSSGRLSQEIAREALGAAADFKDLTLPAAELEPLTGNYRIDQIKLDLAVTAADGKLVIQATGQTAAPVMAQGGGVFRASFDPSLKITFDPPSSAGEKAPSFMLEQGGASFKALRVP